MLNLNAMFGTCESIFNQSNTPKIPTTELQMMEIEIATDLTKVETVANRATNNWLQLDRLLSMYNYVRRYGIDRSFLSLYNRNGQLDKITGKQFPSCESVDTQGYSDSNMSRIFLAAMEDEKEGIFVKIGRSIQWVLDKVTNLCTTIWDKILSWLTGNDTIQQLKKSQKDLEDIVADEEKRAQRISTAKQVVRMAADTLLFPYKTFAKVAAVTWTVGKRVLFMAFFMILGFIADGLTFGMGTVLGSVFPAIELITDRFVEKDREEAAMRRRKRAYMEDLSDSTGTDKLESQYSEMQTKLEEATSKFDKTFETTTVEVLPKDAIGIVKNTIDIETAAIKVREKIDDGLKKVNSVLHKCNKIAKEKVSAVGKNVVEHKTPYKLISAYQLMLKKLLGLILKVESKVRLVCNSIKSIIDKWKQQTP